MWQTQPVAILLHAFKRQTSAPFNLDWRLPFIIFLHRNRRIKTVNESKSTGLVLRLLWLVCRSRDSRYGYSDWSVVHWTRVTVTPTDLSFTGLALRLLWLICRSRDSHYGYSDWSVVQDEVKFVWWHRCLLVKDFLHSPVCSMQGDHLSGKPENVRYFDSWQSRVSDQLPCGWDSQPAYYLGQLCLALRVGGDSKQCTLLIKSKGTLHYLLRNRQFRSTVQTTSWNYWLHNRCIYVI